MPTLLRDVGMAPEIYFVVVVVGHAVHDTSVFLVGGLFVVTHSITYG